MATPNVVLSSLHCYLRALRSQLWLWWTPALLSTLLAAGYAAWKPAAWQASQTLVVRDEAIGNLNLLGRFDSVESMRAFQETILEVARSRVAVLGALNTLGPPPGRSPRQPWPTEEEIEQLQDRITVGAPKGAEFGSTEVIYLSVVGPSRAEALRRTTAICDQLEKRLADLRNAKAASVLAELENTLALAVSDQEQVTARLEAMEREVGSDLGELRMLNDSGSGDSNLRTALNQVSAELRQVRSTHEANRQLDELLRAAERSPEQLLATPSRLMESQATLRRLKEGLVDAQLHTATLRGRMREDHPAVLAARHAEAEVQQNLTAELQVAIRAIAADLQVSQRQLESLQRQEQELQFRLDRLAGLRARYGNLVDDLRQRTQIANEVKQKLAEARASQTSAQSTSLLTRFHAPVAGEHPLGPSRIQLLAGGSVGGLLIGVGLVFLTMPTGPRSGRRWTDLLSFGRRAADRLAGAAPHTAVVSVDRRAEDRHVASPAASPLALAPQPAAGRRAADRG